MVLTIPLANVLPNISAIVIKQWVCAITTCDYSIVWESTSGLLVYLTVDPV